MQFAPVPTPEQVPFSLDPGLLQWLGTGPWGLAIVLIVRGLMARSRVQKDLTDLRAQSLAVLQTDHLQVVLKEVVLFLINALDGRIRHHDEDRVLPLLARADLSPQRRRLAEVGADALDFDRLQNAIVSASHRLGWAAALFLIPWTYLLFWGSQKGVDLPVALTAGAGAGAASCLGYGLAQAWEERTASVRFASLQRTYETGL